MKEETLPCLVGLLAVAGEPREIITQQDIERLRPQVGEHLLVARAPLNALAARQSAVLVALAHGPAFSLGELLAVSILLLDAEFLLLVATEAPVKCDSHSSPLLSRHSDSEFVQWRPRPPRPCGSAHGDTSHN